MYSCLSIRPHRIKINKDFGDKTDIEFGAPQRFVLGPLLFNIDVVDLVGLNITIWKLIS